MEKIDPCIIAAGILALFAVGVVFRKYAVYVVLALVALLAILIFPNGALLITVAGGLAALGLMIRGKALGGGGHTVNVNGDGNTIIIDETPQK
jgi:hypothetical protein